MAVSAQTEPEIHKFSVPFRWEIKDYSNLAFGEFFQSKTFSLPSLRIQFTMSKTKKKKLNVYIHRLFDESPVLTLRCELCLFAKNCETCYPEKLNDTFTFNKDYNRLPLAIWSTSKITENFIHDSSLIFSSTFYVAVDVTTEKSNDNAQMIAQVPNVSEKLSEDLKNLLLDGEDYDVTVNVKEVKFQAHKAILKARSTVFRAMLTHDMVEKNDGVVNIDDCDPDCFKDYLLHLYSGKNPEISRENVVGLYFVSDKYDAEEVKTACLQFMLNDLCKDTFFSYVAIGLRHQETELLNTAKEFFAKNMKDIVGSSHWLMFIEENPTESQEFLLYGLSTGTFTPGKSTK